MAPFTQPEIVDVSGFRLVKYGSLKRKEAMWFTDRDRYVMQGMINVLQIAQEIAMGNNLDPAIAYQIVSAYGTSEVGSDLLVPYADRLAPLLDLLGYQENTPSEACTMFLQSRLSKAWLEENKALLASCFGIAVESDHWQPGYTAELPEAVLEGIWDFIKGEQRQWKEPPKVDPVEALPVGEDSASTESSSPETPTSIGETSTGQSSLAPSATPDSTPPTSTTVPSTFSSTRVNASAKNLETAQT
jgi:hypothetical protein